MPGDQKGISQLPDLAPRIGSYYLVLGDRAEFQGVIFSQSLVLTTTFSRLLPSTREGPYLP